MEISATERKIKWASFLIGGGLLVQLGSLLIVHPLAFVAFLMVGCPLTLAGIVLYLLALISADSSLSDCNHRKHS